MCNTEGKSVVCTIFSTVGTLFMLFLYTVFKTKPHMYDELENPELTCKGLMQTAIAYFVTFVVSAGCWIYHVQKAKHTVVVEETAFQKSKKRFHFATIDNDIKAPLLQEEM